jgi:hypothetical protein
MNGERYLISETAKAEENDAVFHLQRLLQEVRE